MCSIKSHKVIFFSNVFCARRCALRFFSFVGSEPSSSPSSLLFVPDLSLFFFGDSKSSFSSSLSLFFSDFFLFFFGGSKSSSSSSSLLFFSDFFLFFSLSLEDRSFFSFPLFLPFLSFLSPFFFFLSFFLSFLLFKRDKRLTISTSCFSERQFLCAVLRKCEEYFQLLSDVKKHILHLYAKLYKCVTQ
jgi:hypothetical protein